ncbi:MAG: tRNA lysidine(34) synthetase TilS [Myxococcales bacterium]|nr:tRNA lysidine(34) synthetase TilS [Myxococcales bacterium]
MLVREVSAAVGRLGLEGRSVLVAASGGLDSTALVHALCAVSERNGLNLWIGHVNHGLRGKESEADEAAVRDLGGALGLPVRVARVDPGALREGRPSRERPTLQEAARTLRYRALAALAEEAGAARVATAHTADDQAETVLLRLLRGTGPDGLGGIPERSPDGRIVRPLLRVSRVEIERFACERRLRWREDSSNERVEYARNRLRRHWLPGLARDFNPRLLRAIGSLAEAQREDSEWIATRVEREADSRFAMDGRWLHIDAKDWSEMPEALARRLARWALVRCGEGRAVSRVHLERVLAFLRSGRPGTRIELPGGLRLERAGDGFCLGPAVRDPESF